LATGVALKTPVHSQVPKSNDTIVCAWLTTAAQTSNKKS